MKKIISQYVINIIKIFIFFVQKEIALQVFGFIILCIFIWIRFIKERLPRDIPFDLSFFSFFILLIICISHIYIIYRILKHVSSNNLTAYLMPLFKILFSPLIKTNEFILSKKFLRQLLKMLLILLFKLFKHNILINNSDFIYAYIYIIPRIIFTFCFVIDIFYLKQLHLIYGCILMITLPLLIQYLLHISETIKAFDVELFDKYFIIEITSEDIEYSKHDYDNDGMFKGDVPSYYEDPSLIKYYCFYENYDNVLPYLNLKQYKYLKVTNFIEYQACAIYFHHLLYEYKILYHNEREDTKVIVPEPLILNKKDCENFLQFYITIYVLKDFIDAYKNMLTILTKIY